MSTKRIAERPPAKSETPENKTAQNNQDLHRVRVQNMPQHLTGGKDQAAELIRAGYTVLAEESDDQMITLAIDKETYLKNQQFALSKGQQRLSGSRTTNHELDTFERNPQPLSSIVDSLPEYSASDTEEDQGGA